MEGTTAELLDRAERLFAECREMFLASGFAVPEDLPLERALERGRHPR